MLDTSKVVVDTIFTNLAQLNQVNLKERCQTIYQVFKKFQDDKITGNFQIFVRS